MSERDGILVQEKFVLFLFDKIIRHGYNFIGWLDYLGITALLRFLELLLSIS